MKIAITIGISVICLTLPSIVGAQSISNTQPFTIAIAADNPEVKAGSNVCVQVSLTNNSSQNLDLNGGTSGYTGLDPNYRFEVRDESGNLARQKVYPHPEFFGSDPYDYTLKPNETHEQDQCVSALYDLAKSQKYTIQAFRPPANNNSQGGEIASNVITVSVLPAVSGAQVYSLVIAPVNPTIKTGSKICVQINAGNNSSQDLDIGHASANGMDAQFRFEVRDAGGNLLPEKANPFPATGAMQGHTKLKPSDAESIQQCPSMLYDMSTPGKYTIQAFWGIPKDGEISSNIVTVTVVP